MPQNHILLVDDNLALANMYETFLVSEGYMVTFAHSAEDSLQRLENSPPVDVMILDIKLPDQDGLTFLKELKELGFDSPVIIITGHGSISTAVEAMRLGASDFLVKPFDLNRLKAAAEKACGNQGLISKSETAREPDNHKLESFQNDITGFTETQNIKNKKEVQKFGSFIGTSQVMQVTYDVIENAARSKAAVFITGESGTGKEVCAQAVHKLSDRSKGPFIVLNCAAIPKDLIESELFGHIKGAFTGASETREGAASLANGGTLFLDEIADMDTQTQTKLLRFLQNYSFQKIGSNKLETTDVRIICATNKDISEEIKQGRFRQDLYYRLHVIPIHMPALADREEDIIDIANIYLRQYAAEEKKKFTGFTQEAESYLLSCSWPGNIRQVQNVVRHIVVMYDSDLVTVKMLPSEITQNVRQNYKSSGANNGDLFTAQGTVLPLWKIEKKAIEQAITLCKGNIPKAAAMLEISPSTIYRKKLQWENSERKENRLT